MTDPAYADAMSYLSLTMSDKVAEKIVADMIDAPERQVSAKDLLRAAGVKSWGGLTDVYVWDALNRLDKGYEIGLVLVYRTAGKAVIAAGFYELCAAYHKDRYAVVNCKVV